MCLGECIWRYVFGREQLKCRISKGLGTVTMKSSKNEDGPVAVRGGARGASFEVMHTASCLQNMNIQATSTTFSLSPF